MVIGEAVRTVLPERAEFLVEITANGQTAAQALRDNQAKTMQITQALAQVGVTQSDVHPMTLKVNNLYSPLPLPSYGGIPPQITQAGFTPYAPAPGVQPEIQFGSFQARSTLRISVREPGRIGEIADATARAGVTTMGAFSFHAADEAHARGATLEAAVKDAKRKAESLASATGVQLGEIVTITEDISTTNGTYAALRATVPFAFGAGAPETIGELEYYARVSATFKIQPTAVRST